MARPVDQPVRIGPDVVFRALGDQMVLVHLGDDRVYEMNDTGAFIWTKLSDGATPAQAAAALVETFEVSLDDARRSVAALIDTLEQAALIV
jgi:hypothetical protein